jgi:hypothetical protein
MRIRKFVPRLGIAGLLAAVLVGPVSAAVISVELGNNEALEPADAAGVVSAANWKQASGSPDFSGVALNFSDGTASGATIAGDFSSNLTTRVAVTGDTNTEMFNRGGGINSAAGSDITVSDLPTTGDWAQGYDVYIYFAPSSADNSTRTLNLAIGGTTYYAEIDTGSSNYSGSFEQVDSTSIIARESGNYAVFSGLSGNSFTLNLTSNVQNVIGATGLQIVAVPEPASMMLVAAGAVLIGFRRR